MTTVLNHLLKRPALKLLDRQTRLSSFVHRQGTESSGRAGRS